MKIRDIIFSIGIVVLIIAVAVVVLFKFVLNHSNPSFRLDALDSLILVDMNGNSINFSGLLDKNKETYCLIFELTNCYSCIYNGIEDLKKLQKAGRESIAIVVDGRVDEVAGWSEKQGFSPFFMLNKVDFYDNIQSSTLPVMIKIKASEVVSYRYITP